MLPLSWIDEAVRRADANRVFDELAEQFKHDGQYGNVFNVRLMQKRLELGLALTAQPTIDALPAALQQPYQDAYLRAAREVGQLFLSDGNIPAAWPYFRALGDVGPVTDAIEAIDSRAPVPADAHDRLSAIIQIAFQEGAHPRKGLELMLAHYGMCRAVTMFGAYPSRHGRSESLHLLVGALHDEIVANLERAIVAKEGRSPDTSSIRALLDGRDWLFENNAQYTDSSHLAGLLRFCMDLDDQQALEQAVAIAEYGSRLSPMFQYSDDPPFDRSYEDRAIYLRALAGRQVEQAIAHFTARADAADLERDGTRPAEVLIVLLTRLERHDEAVRAFRRYLSDVPHEHLSCPSLAQLCEMAGDFDQMKEIAERQNDPLAYMAAVIGNRSES